jgi:hypothetical protein
MPACRGANKLLTVDNFGSTMARTINCVIHKNRRAARVSLRTSP